MSIDLESALADLAQSVHDDGVADRMNGQVRQMVGRIRRRRAARYSATGVVGVGAVAAVAVAGLQLADRYPASVPPAGTEPIPDSAADGLSLECGDRVPAETLRPEREGFRLELEVPGPAADSSEVPVVVRLVHDGDAYLSWDTDQILQLAALRDGEIVATATIPTSRGDYTGGSSWIADRSVSLSQCAGEGALGAGDCELVASVIFANADGSAAIGLSAGLAPVTITDSPLDEAAATAEAELRAAENELQAIIAASAQISVEYPFGVCGTRVPEGRDAHLALDIELTSVVHEAGALLEGTAGITARDGLTVLGNAPITSVHVVLVRDGVVVGRGDYEPEYTDMLTFTADRPYPLPAYGNALVCSLPGATATEPPLWLPAGAYQAYGVYEVGLKEVQTSGGAESRSETVTLVSDPVNVVMEGPHV